MGDYVQSAVDERISRNFRLMVVLVPGLAYLASRVADGINLLLLELPLGVFLFTWFWRWRKYLAFGYKIDSTSLRIIRAWPFKDIIIPLDEIRHVRFGDLISSVYVTHSSIGGRGGNWMYVRKALTIPLYENHELNHSDPNAFNCLFLEPGILGYYASVPANSGIKVLPFVSDIKKLVLLETPINYIISPSQPEEFVRDLNNARKHG